MFGNFLVLFSLSSGHTVRTQQLFDECTFICTWYYDHVITKQFIPSSSFYSSLYIKDGSFAFERAEDKLKRFSE